jgi:hypothetical protein
VESRQALRAIGFVALICFDIWTAAAIARAVGSGDGSGGIFWGAVALLSLLLGASVYLTIRTAARLGIDGPRIQSAGMWRHGWKLGLLPLFFDVSVGIKYLCGTILVASLVVDVALEVQERRLRG